MDFFNFCWVFQKFPFFCVTLYNPRIQPPVEQCVKTHVLRVHHATYLLTPWSRVLLETLTGSQLVKKFPAFYGTRRFITAYSQVPATCPYPEPVRFNPKPHIPLPEDPFLYYPPIYAWIFQSGNSLP